MIWKRGDMQTNMKCCKYWLIPVKRFLYSHAGDDGVECQDPGGCCHLFHWSRHVTEGVTVSWDPLTESRSHVTTSTASPIIIHNTLCLCVCHAVSWISYPAIFSQIHEKYKSYSSHSFLMKWSWYETYETHYDWGKYYCRSCAVVWCKFGKFLIKAV